MTHFAVARESDGVILYQGRSDQPMAQVLESWPLAGNVAAEIPEPLEQQEHWRVVDGVCVARAVMEPLVSATSIAADGAEEAVISGLPDPCEVRVAGAVSAPWTTVAGGSVTLTSTASGEIRIDVRADPTHCPWSTTIHAV